MMSFGFDSDRWCAYFWFVGWDCISLGIHLCLGAPNFELHLPFGFIRIGRKKKLRRLPGTYYLAQVMNAQN